MEVVPSFNVVWNASCSFLYKSLENDNMLPAGHFRSFLGLFGSGELLLLCDLALSDEGLRDEGSLRILVRESMD